MTIQDLKNSGFQLRKTTLSMLKSWVDVNSFTTNKEGVNEVGKLTAEAFAELGFAPESVPPADPAHGDHLYLHRGPREKKPIILVTHLDTVFPPEEEQKNNFRWQQEGKIIFGPGTVDNKGGTAVIWLTLQMIKLAAPDVFENTHWIVAANSAEEVIGADFGNQTRKRCPQGAEAVLVFEGGYWKPGEYYIVTKRKGRAEYRVTCQGRAAHAGGNHAAGINAVVELAKILPSIHALTDYDQGLTLNVANFHGGTVLNRVPHEATVELEMRAFDPAVLMKAGDDLRSFAGTTEAGAEIIVECLGTTQAWPGGETTEKLFQIWSRSVQMLGAKAVEQHRGGLSDANHLSDLGPTLDGMGPYGMNAHCSERSADGSKLPEYVKRNSFVRKAVINALALYELVTGSPWPVSEGEISTEAEADDS